MQEESTTQSAVGKPQVNRSNAKLSAVELAAERGIGPLSPLGMKVWHGEAFPCVSCGQLVRRNQIRCSECGEDLSLKMIMKMQAHAGPWYVHEHVRPFPGVTLERLIRQVQRGVLTPTTIVRGPTTYHQWRFAAETPGLSKHLGLCWNCQAKVTPEETHCGVCRVNLDQPAGLAPGMEPPESDDQPLATPPPPPPTQTATPPATPAPPPPPPAPEPEQAEAPQASPPAPAPLPRQDVAADMAQLQEALRSSAPPPADKEEKAFPTGIIIAAIVLATVLGLLGIVKLREHSRTANQPTAIPAATIAPGETVNES